MIKLVIFDLDGTLLNSIADLAKACNEALFHYGLPTHDESAYHYFVGNGIEKLIEKALPKDYSQETYENVHRYFMNYYIAHTYDLTRPYKNITKLLEILKNKNIMMAVASNKFVEGVRKLVSHFFPNIEFIMVQGKSEDIPTKPNPLMVEQIIEKAHVNRNKILYLGDTSIDMKTAKRVNVKAIGVSWGFRTREELIASGADIIIDDPLEILEML